MRETLRGDAAGIEYLKQRIAVEPSTGCWLWQKSVGGPGYGQVFWRGKVGTAHRLSYSLYHGDPGKLHVLHRCGNRRCCNPDHLYAGTDRDNHRDSVNHGTHCPPPLLKGEQVGNAKLTDLQASAIKQRLLSGESCKRLAKAYGVSLSTISLIKRNLRYAHVAPFIPEQSRRNRTRLSPVQAEEIKARLEKGESMPAIARCMKLPYYTVFSFKSRRLNRN